MSRSRCLLLSLACVTALLLLSWTADARERVKLPMTFGGGPWTLVADLPPAAGGQVGFGPGASFVFTFVGEPWELKRRKRRKPRWPVELRLGRRVELAGALVLGRELQGWFAGGFWNAVSVGRAFIGGAHRLDVDLGIRAMGGYLSTDRLPIREEAEVVPPDEPLARAFLLRPGLGLAIEHAVGLGFGHTAVNVSWDLWLPSDLMDNPTLDVAGSEHLWWTLRIGLSINFPASTRVWM